MPRKARDLSRPETKDVTIRGVTFTVAEFPEHEAELYDDFYHEHGGYDIDRDIQLNYALAERIPQSEVVQLLMDDLEPLEKKLRIRKRVYKETRDPKTRDEMFDLAGEIDTLKDRIRTATQHMDAEQVVPMRLEYSRKNADVLKRLRAIKFDFCHMLATERGLTEMSLEEWREGASKADKDAASLIVNTGKKFLTRSRKLDDQEEEAEAPQEKTSETSAPLTN